MFQMPNKFDVCEHINYWHGTNKNVINCFLFFYSLFFVLSLGLTFVSLSPGFSLSLSHFLPLILSHTTDLHIVHSHSQILIFFFWARISIFLSSLLVLAVLHGAHEFIVINRAPTTLGTKILHIWFIFLFILIWVMELFIYVVQWVLISFGFCGGGGERERERERERESKMNKKMNRCER